MLEFFKRKVIETPKEVNASYESSIPPELTTKIDVFYSQIENKVSEPFKELESSIPAELNLKIENFYNEIMKAKKEKDGKELEERYIKDVENKKQGEKSFYTRVLNMINKAKQENPEKEIIVFFDIDETLLQKKINFDTRDHKTILRPTALELLKLINSNNIKVGFLTTRVEKTIIDDLEKENELKSLEPYIERNCILSSNILYELSEELSENGYNIKEEAEKIEESFNEKGIINSSHGDVYKVMTLNVFLNKGKSKIIPILVDDYIGAPQHYKYGIPLTKQEVFSI